MACSCPCGQFTILLKQREVKAKGPWRDATLESVVVGPAEAEDAADRTVQSSRTSGRQGTWMWFACQCSRCHRTPNQASVLVSSQHIEASLHATLRKQNLASSYGVKAEATGLWVAETVRQPSNCLEAGLDTALYVTPEEGEGNQRHVGSHEVRVSRRTQL